MKPRGSHQSKTVWSVPSKVSDEVYCTMSPKKASALLSISFQGEKVYWNWKACEGMRTHRTPWLHYEGMRNCLPLWFSRTINGISLQSFLIHLMRKMGFEKSTFFSFNSTEFKQEARNRHCRNSRYFSIMDDTSKELTCGDVASNSKSFLFYHWSDNVWKWPGRI